MIRPYYNLDNERDRPGGFGSFGPGIRIGSPLTPAVKGLIVACIAVFVFQIILGDPRSGPHARFIELFGFKPALGIGSAYLWQFVTYMFLHGNFMHILFNMFFFWMIGGMVEMRLGTRRFLWLFFLAGVMGAAAQGAVFYLQDALGLDDSMGQSVIGASGAIMGVAAACGALFPDMKMLLFFIIPMRMKHFVILMAVLDILAASNGADNVAHFAHLAGLAVGYLFVRYEPRLEPRILRPWYALRARMRGISRVAPPSTHIDDDDKYREEVDRILDKIFRESTASLTEDEKRTLEDASKRQKKARDR